MTDANHYDYTAEKNDYKDTIGFGKYKNCTPSTLAQIEPKYIVWAWKNTEFWVGSEELVRNVHRIVGETFRERTDKAKQADTESREPMRIEAFEEACLDTFGCFPYKSWNT